MMPRPGELIVRGEAARDIEPSRATVFLTVAGTGTAPRVAMDALVPRASALDEVLDSHAGAFSNRVTSSLSLQEIFEHDDRGRPRVTGYDAARLTTVEVTDLTVLGIVLREAVDRAEARLRGPVWSIDDDHPVHDEVRADAATDARRRASAYAVGLGVSLGSVEWLRDAGLATERPGGLAMMARAMPAVAAGGPIEVDVGQITVTAAVDVAFRLVL